MIKARIEPANLDANLKSYEETYANFSWSDVEKEFTWSETGRLNLVHEAVDRWADDEKKRDQRALVFEKGGRVKEYTYAELRDISSQWANLFIEQGFGSGDRMFILLPPCPEVFFAMLACARLGIVFYVLFLTLSYDEVEARLEQAKPRGIVTHPDLAERLAPQAMGSVEHIFYTEGVALDVFPSEIVVEDVIGDYSTKSTMRWVNKTTPLYLIYTTSGSQGPPKGVIHGHGDMVGHLATARYVLDIKEDSVIWTD